MSGLGDVQKQQVESIAKAQAEALLHKWAKIIGAISAGIGAVLGTAAWIVFDSLVDRKVRSQLKEQEPSIVKALINEKSFIDSVKPTTVNFLQVAATGDVGTPWISTGLKIKGGQKVRVSSHGRICIAAHRMYESACNPDNPRPPAP